MSSSHRLIASLAHRLVDSSLHRFTPPSTPTVPLVARLIESSLRRFVAPSTHRLIDFLIIDPSTHRAFAPPSTCRPIAPLLHRPNRFANPLPHPAAHAGTARVSRCSLSCRSHVVLRLTIKASIAEPTIAAGVGPPGRPATAAVVTLKGSPWAGRARRASLKMFIKVTAVRYHPFVFHRHMA